MERVMYINHNNEDVTITMTDDVCTATSDDGDMFFHFEFSDTSVDPKTEIVDEFGEDVYNELVS